MYSMIPAHVLCCVVSWQPVYSCLASRGGGGGGKGDLPLLRGTFLAHVGTREGSE